ncbi:MAG: single-stranded DNA-binding protein [Clostridia bacterium]|nr:single-stranded DNA-binding protein [Clostridia bacterium]
MNSCNFIGRLTADPEIRQSQGDSPTLMARFSLAVERRGNKGKTDFFRMEALGQQAAFCQKYLHKGMKVGLETRAEQERYENNEGRTVEYVQFLVESVTFCESKRGAEDTEETPFL